MRKGINYWAFTSDRGGGGADPRAALRYARSLGYDCFEPTVDGEHGLLSLNSDEHYVAQVVDAARECGIAIETLASGLAWSCSPSDPDPQIRARAVAQSEKLLQIAAWLGAHSLLYIPGMVSAAFVPNFKPQASPEVERRARQAIEQLLPTAERLGVRLAIENVWNRFLLSPVEMRDFIDSFDSPWVGAYFDTGNCMLYGHPEDWIAVLGSRICAVHLKDFRVAVGNLNGFVDLLAGDVDFIAVLDALEAAEYRGPYTIEYVPALPGAVEKGIAALSVLEHSGRHAAEEGGRTS